MDGPSASTPDQDVLSLHGREQPLGRRPDAAPVLTVDGFEGPLDWLLDLTRAHRIDLARLSIAALIGAFEEALAAALAAAALSPAVLGRWGDWLVMAADLTLLRSRLLVPDAAAAQEAHDDAERLRQRLLNRAAVARAVAWLEARDQLGCHVFARGVADSTGTGRVERRGDITALLRACLAAIRLPADAEGPLRVAGPPFWSVSDATERIRAMLPLIGDEEALLEAFLPEVPAEAPERELRCRAAVAGTFLAALELARDGSIAVQQTAVWATIQVRRRAGSRIE
jgi:segregation and condensation protein A